MTAHDAARRDRALAALSDPCAQRETILDAIGGIQSTDDPSLCCLHDALQERLKQLVAEDDQPEPRGRGWITDDPDYRPEEL